MIVQLYDNDARRFKRCGYIKLSPSQEWLELKIIGRRNNTRTKINSREILKQIYFEVKDVCDKYFESR